MSILSAFVAYVVVDWCSGVDWLVVGGDLCFSGVEWWLCELVFVWDRWVIGFVAGLVVVVSLVLIVGTVLVIAEFELSC